MLDDPGLGVKRADGQVRLRRGRSIIGLAAGFASEGAGALGKLAEGGNHDLGLGAQRVAPLAPRVTFRSEIRLKVE